MMPVKLQLMNNSMTVQQETYQPTCNLVHPTISSQADGRLVQRTHMIW